MSKLLWIALLPSVPGCVQLVAFDQAIIGQPDVVDERSEGAGGRLCDPDVEMGASALCAESCEIDAARGETSCGARVALDGSSGRIDVAGMHEMELTLTVCGRRGEHFAATGDNGARFALRDRSLHVTAAARANARPYEDPEFLDDEDGCQERTLLFQTGRMALQDSGRRLCSADLLPVDGTWQFELSRTGLRSIELCFRAPRASRASVARSGLPDARE